MSQAGITAGFSCKFCQKPDDSQMVCCDECDQWYHFQCVNVTSSIEHEDWRCSYCSAASTGQSNLVNDNLPSASNNVTSGPALPSGKSNEEHNTPIREGALPEVPQHGRTSRHSNFGGTLTKARRLQAEAMLLEEEQQILQQKEALLERRRQLLQRAEAEEESDSDEELNVTAVQKWLNATGITLPNSAPPKTPTSNQHPPSRPQAQPVIFQGRETICDGNVQREINSLMQKLSTLEQQLRTRPIPVATNTWLPNLMPEDVPVNRDPQQPPSKPVTQSIDFPCLTKNQLAARKGLCKELPKFDGKPEEWPLFVATFQQTTELCGFSEGENLIRLRQALEGPARNAVRNLLLHASCVPQIIDTLQMKFGRPELIINVLTNRIRDIPAVKEDRMETLVDLALEVQNVCATMKASNMLCHLNNPELEQKLVAKLPGLLAAFWGMHKLQLQSPNLESFGNWLFQLAQGANSVILPNISSKAQTKRGYLNAHTNDIGPRARICAACSGDCVALDRCADFQTMSRPERWKLVRVRNICRRCLKRHNKLPCSSTTICNVDGCSFIHHPLLHRQSSVPLRTIPGNSAVNAHSYDADSILFRVLPVTLYGNNRQLKTYAFFDDGSSLTLMDADLQKSLDLKGTPQPLCLKWTADAHRYENDSHVLDLEISGVNSKRRFSLKDVRTVQRLELPMQSVNAAEIQARYAYLNGIPLPSYAKAAPRLLIGLNNSRLGQSLKMREGSIGEPIAEKTRLGWTLKGLTAKKESQLSSGYHAFHACDCETTANAELLQIVKDHICLDNVDVAKRLESPSSAEERHAAEQLKTNTKHINGRYETSLIWKSGTISHPDSLPMALRRAKCLQTKLARDPELAETLTAKVSAYVRKGYAKQLPRASLSDRKCWYLPIFPVYNPNKPGKVRLVWDAAAKVDNVSLNSMLLKGPDQLTCLVSVLRRFRQRAIAVSGDIEEMFHQVQIRPQDQDYQRFLWFDPGATEPSVFIMTVMTFGATCSPSTAQYVKNFNAEEFRTLYPRAVNCIITNHYVDDMLDSVDTPDEAIQLAKNVSFIHAQAGFNIRNWRSNSEEVLKALKTGAADSDINFNPSQEVPAEKILGLWWLAGNDCFTFRVSANHQSLGLLNTDHHPTKREVLRVVMSVFDPLGMLGFFVIYAKVVLQDIWRSGCGWDDRIPDEQRCSWLKWIELFPKIEKLQIPRCYFKNICQESHLALHVFVDASENAFGAVCFLRHSLHDAVHCTLVASKAKVAPLKMLSIPRLELQAAVVGARLAAGVLNSLTLPINEMTFWTDSRTVLSWIRSDHRRYSQFVAFRVSEILELAEADSWRWVPSAENVADDATKWKNTPTISNEARWFTGPEFLKLHPKHWPTDVQSKEATQEELRAKYVGLHDQKQYYGIPLGIHIRFSRWTRLLRTTATILLVARTWKTYRRGSSGLHGLLDQSDLRRAETLLWKEAQRDVYCDEVSLLAKGKPIDRSSSIYKLSPYLDDQSLLRLEGRAKILGRQDHIILPRNHNITRLIIFDYHIRYQHCNSETVVNEIRQVFWIPRLRVVVNKVRRECQTCCNDRATPQPPKMSALPAARTAPFSRPFSYVGVDYFGPISVVVRRSTEKRYGVLLTCLTTRAVHIEIAHSLTSDSCIIAIRSFMARRGIPLEFWSDNATNFKASQRELVAAFSAMDRDKLVSTFTNSCTKWKFIPPASPHMGGAWERLVRSVKNTLSKTLQSLRPSDEQLRGALMEVETVINSRPLTYIPLGHEDDEALTPNHFLLGSSSGMKPLTEFSNEPTHIRRGWRYSQQVADMFWRRWLREYLPMITRRTKWFEKAKPVEEGDVVFIVDPNGPRNCWPRGRVISVNKSSDGQVRSAKVKTYAGIYERPVTKLAVLSINASEGEVDPADIPGGSVTKDTATP